MKADFEEKQYEGLANSELEALPSGQVAEHLLGYDAVAHPHVHHEVWKYLANTPLPGVILKPNNWKYSARPSPTTTMMPDSAVSLILQYKRPEYMMRDTAKNWHLWNAPYYRFKIDKGQHQVLDSLETVLAKSALVRYATPAFHTRSELEQHWLARTALANSGFVQPTSITGHDYWTYRSSGTFGIPNPETAQVKFETKDELLANAGKAAASGASIGDHLADLQSGLVAAASAADEWSIVSDYNVPVPAISDFRPEQSAMLFNLKFVAGVSAFLGITWHLVVAGNSRV